MEFFSRKFLCWAGREKLPRSGYGLVNERLGAIERGRGGQLAPAGLADDESFDLFVGLVGGEHVMHDRVPAINVGLFDCHFLNLPNKERGKDRLIL
jgi:hypothetical protein